MLVQLVHDQHANLVGVLDVRLDAFAVTLDGFRFRSRRDITKNVIVVDTVALKTVWEPILGLCLAYATVPIGEISNDSR